MSKFFNLGSKKIYNNYNSSLQLSRLHASLLMSIVETPKKYLYNVEVKSDTGKIITSSVNLSSKLFYV